MDTSVAVSAIPRSSRRATFSGRRSSPSDYLTPSGVSRAVARLEMRLGVRLFERTPRVVTLTDDGRRFHAQIDPLLAAIEEAADEVSGAAAAGLRRCSTFRRVGAIQSIARKLLETRILTCAAPAYLARRGTPEHPQDLGQHECLLFRDPVTGRPFPWEFRRDDEVIEVKVSGRLVVNDLATKLTACAAGHGISQTFALGVDRLLATGELVQILPDWAEERFPLYAYHPSRHFSPAKVRAFLDFVLASVASSAPDRAV